MEVLGKEHEASATAGCLAGKVRGTPEVRLHVPGRIELDEGDGEAHGRMLRRGRAAGRRAKRALRGGCGRGCRGLRLARRILAVTGRPAIESEARLLVSGLGRHPVGLLLAPAR